MIKIINLIKTIINQRLKNTHTALPGIIVDFDEDTQLATVQPVINRVFKQEESDGYKELELAMPPLINVLVQFPRSGGYVITFPVKKGDECQLIFNERSIDEWYLSGKVSTPSSKAIHTLDDAVAILGISSKVNKIEYFDNTKLTLRSEDNNLKITMDSSDNSIELTSTKVKITGDCDILGTLKAGGKTVNNHNHRFINSDGVPNDTGPMK